MTRTLLRTDVLGDEPESLFRRRVIRFAKLRGWLVFYTADSVGTTPGEFDLRMYRPPRVIHAELKSEHGHLSQDQKRVRAIYEGCPALETHVWKPSAWLDIEQALL